MINKAGRSAKTNFPMADYASELDELVSMPTAELVGLLRARARKQGAQTSRHRGVSLLRQTGRWHAQINVDGRQVHLGFFSSEEAAARAYDRAAINKGAHDESGTGKLITNHSIDDYGAELEQLAALPTRALVSALADDRTRRGAMALLAGGFHDRGAVEAVFGREAAAGRGAFASSSAAHAASARRICCRPSC